MKPAHVVGDQKDLDQDARHEDQQTQDEEADAPVEQDAAQHDQWGKQSKAGIRTKQRDDFSQ